MTTDLAALENAVQAKKLEKKIFIFAGRENFFKERTLDKLIQGFISPEDLPENIRRLECEHLKIEELLEGFNRFSFNDSLRFTILHKPENFAAADRKALCVKLRDNPPPPDVVLFFLTMDTRVATELTAGLDQLCERLDFWPPYEHQFPGWIQSEARALGLQITSGAVDLLLQKVGTDLRLLFQELEKLGFQIPKGGKITEDLVDRSVGILRHDSVFDLVEQIGLRNLPRAMKILENLLQFGEESLPMFGAVVKALREYRLLHDLMVDRPDLLSPVKGLLLEYLKLFNKSEFKASQEKKRLTSEIQERIKSWPPFLVDSLRLDNIMQIKNLAPALNYSREELLKFWPKLLETDQALKSSLPNQKLPLQEMLVELIPRKGRAEK